MSSDRPDWLPQAWIVRAVFLTILLVVLAFPLTLRWPWFPWAFPLVLAMVLAADWAWLRRNHHRIDETGLSKGKHFRRRPK